MISLAAIEALGGTLAEGPLTPEAAEALRGRLPQLTREEVIEELQDEVTMYFECHGDLAVDSATGAGMLRTMSALLHAIAALQALPPSAFPLPASP